MFLSLLSFYIMTWIIYIVLSIIGTIRASKEPELLNYIVAENEKNERRSKLAKIKDIFMTFCPILNITNIIFSIIIIFGSLETITKSHNFYNHYILGISEED